uniref:Uncharacterized protein n=1 Tax=Oryza brachyantha TaxID=4533 RepID=J3LUP7_ORYBR
MVVVVCSFGFNPCLIIWPNASAIGSNSPFRQYAEMSEVYPTTSGDSIRSNTSLAAGKEPHREYISIKQPPIQASPANPARTASECTCSPARSAPRSAHATSAALHAKSFGATPDSTMSANIARASSGRPLRVHPDMTEVHATTFFRGIRSNRSSASASLPDLTSLSSRLHSRTTSGGSAQPSSAGAAEHNPTHTRWRRSGTWHSAAGRRRVRGVGGSAAIASPVAVASHGEESSTAKREWNG